MQLHEKWYHYVCDELYPHVMAETGYSGRAGITGCSMGAYHAANFFFRRPDLFDTVIALSGVYDPALLIHGYFDATMYMNSPVHSLRNMPPDHPYMELFRQSKIIICVGQGAWEGTDADRHESVDEVLSQKGIPAWIDYWGYDVNHDWPGGGNSGGISSSGRWRGEPAVLDHFSDHFLGAAHVSFQAAKL